MTSTLEASAPDTVPAAAQPHRHRARNVVWAVLAALLVASLVFAGYWRASGGRWYVVQTPSMGTAAPVGTLLWVKPVDYAELAVGDFISFRPPGSSTTYSHRILTINADDTLTTKGDANDAPDPWRLSRSNVVGVVDTR